MYPDRAILLLLIGYCYSDESSTNVLFASITLGIREIYSA